MICHRVAGLVRPLISIDLQYAICRTDLEIRNIPVGTGKDQTMHTIIAGDEANPPLVLLPGNILVILTSGFVCLLANLSIPQGASSPQSCGEADQLSGNVDSAKLK